MAFEYTEADVPLQGLDYSMMQPKQQQQQQQQGMSMDPNMIMDMLVKFGVGGGSGALASSAGPAGSGGASQLAGASIGGSSSGGTGGALSGVASNPWAWLAAVIVGNELYAKHRGYRDEDSMDYVKDLFSGEVMHQDIEKRFLPKIGVDEGSKTSKLISHLIQPISADLGESWDRFKDIF
jgi:hypothetical protein